METECSEKTKWTEVSLVINLSLYSLVEVLQGMSLDLRKVLRVLHRLQEL